MRQRTILVAAVSLGLGYAWLRGATVDWTPRMATFAPGARAFGTAPLADRGETHACFAGGCYWSTQDHFEAVPGVTRVVAGTVDGREAVWVAFDPNRVSYRALVDHYWRSIDPFAIGGQFCDLGDRYRAAVFVAGDGTRHIAEASRRGVEARLGRRVPVPVLDDASFVPAPEHLQHFARRHPIQYAFYNWSCGRRSRLASIWGLTSPT